MLAAWGWVAKDRLLLGVPLQARQHSSYDPAMWVGHSGLDNVLLRSRITLTMPARLGISSPKGRWAWDAFTVDCSLFQWSLGLGGEASPCGHRDAADCSTTGENSQ